MSNPKKNSKSYVPNHQGGQSKEAGGNKGKQYQAKGDLQPTIGT